MVVSYWITSTGIYYEGDRAESTDISVFQRPDSNYVWNGGLWVKQTAIPQTVSRRQGRLALAQSGLLSALEAWIATQPQITQVWYQDTSSFDRNNPLIAQAATALNWTPEQLDVLFTLAGTL